MRDKLSDHEPPAELSTEETGDFDSGETGKPIETGIVQDSGRGPECLVTGGGPEEEEGSESRHPLARFCGRCQRYVITFGNPNDLKYQVTDQEGHAIAFVLSGGTLGPTSATLISVLSSPDS